MGRYDGSLRLKQTDADALEVLVDLTDERLLLHTGTSVIGDWPLSELLIRGEDDGFHLRVEGEEVVVKTNDDVGLAIELGLRSASPRLRRQMAARKR